jgi:hypothetical protein
MADNGRVPTTHSASDHVTRRRMTLRSYREQAPDSDLSDSEAPANTVRQPANDAFSSQCQTYLLTINRLRRPAPPAARSLFSGPQHPSRPAHPQPPRLPEICPLADASVADFRSLELFAGEAEILPLARRPGPTLGPLRGSVGTGLSPTHSTLLHTRTSSLQHWNKICFTTT